MNEVIIKELSNELNISNKQVEVVLSLIKDGCTIPFIARYRKEATGNLDENIILKISDKYHYYYNLMERKQQVIKLIDEKGLLTDEIKQNILACTKLVEVEDLYLPYKEKKKTKATEAIKMGLEPLAKLIMSFPTKGDMNSICSIVNVPIKEALENTCYIISEWISDNAYYRKYIRNYIYNNGYIISKVKKMLKMIKKHMKCIMILKNKLSMLKVIVY